MATSVKSLLSQNKSPIRLVETHDSLSTELVREVSGENGQRFDGIWVSGLTQTTYLGIPDTEMVSPLKRALMIASNPKVHRQGQRPLCAAFDADSGGSIDEIPALVAVLVLAGISMVVIEDKALTEPGKKVNSLLGTSDSQGQADMHEFAKVLKTFKAAAKSEDIMVTARIESFTCRKAKKDEAEEKASVEASINDALVRAKLYVASGADAVLIHSKSPSSHEVVSFLEQFRATDAATPLVVVPTAYSNTARAELISAGANVIIYANHLMRAKLQAIGKQLDTLSTRTKEFLLNDEELRVCVEARNFGCLLRKLDERLLSVEEESAEAREFRQFARRCSTEAVMNTVKELAGGDLSGCEANAHIVPVKELLKVNSQQVCKGAEFLSLAEPIRA